MRRPGPWVAISTHYLSNRKVRKVSVYARMLHLASVFWAGEHLNDGEVPEEMLEVLLVYSGAGREHAQELVMAGLWDLNEPDGYLIHDYLEWNTASDEIERKRGLGRERQQRFRADHVTRDARVTDAAVTQKSRAVEVEVEVEENNPPTPRAVALDPPRRRPRRKPGVYDPEFLQWWALYPTAIGKRPAQEAWDKALQMGVTPERLTAALQAALPELRKKDPQYIPHPATWLNQGRWEDETAAVLARAAPTARCFTCRKDVAKGGGCTQGEANLEYCDRKDWVTHGQVHRVPHVDGA